MKTIKIIAVLVLLAIAGTGFTTSVPKDNIIALHSQVVHLTLQKAMTIPGLVQAMQEQLDPSFLNTNQLSYTEVVYYENTAYYISGSYDEWVWFFRPSGPNIDNQKNAALESR